MGEAEVHEMSKVARDVATHPAWERLEDQLRWYDNKSVWNQKLFKRLTIIQFVLAIAIGPIALIGDFWTKYVTAAAAALIAILEGIQHLSQFSTLWIQYRSTAEHLKHEKHLFLSDAGPYRDVDGDERLKLLAERVEELVSTEHAQWVHVSKRAAESKKVHLPTGRE